MKKRIFMALLAAVATFAMTSCGDDKKDDPTPSVATKASFEETSNGCYVEYPDPTGAGMQSTKVEWKWDSNGKVTEYTATVTCSSSLIAAAAYEAYMEDKDGENEEGIKDVKQKGNTIIVEYEITENADTKEEALVAAKFMAAMMGVEGMNIDLSDVVSGDDDTNSDDDDVTGSEE